MCPGQSPILGDDRFLTRGLAGVRPPANSIMYEAMCNGYPGGAGVRFKLRGKDKGGWPMSFGGGPLGFLTSRASRSGVGKQAKPRFSVLIR